MDIDPPAEPVVPLQVRRQTGSYRLSDFIIHRTLGTGSFGRVHLGELWSLKFCPESYIAYVPHSAEQTQSAFLRRQDPEQGEDRPHEAGIAYAE